MAASFNKATISIIKSVTYVPIHLFILSLVYTKQKYIGTGESSDVEYASDETKFDLRGYLGDEIGDDTGQKYTRKFTIDVDGGNINDVHFKVHGTVTAWYKYPVIKFRK